MSKKTKTEVYFGEKDKFILCAELTSEQMKQIHEIMEAAKNEKDAKRNE